MPSPLEDPIVDVTECLHSEWGTLADQAADAIFGEISSYSGVDREAVQRSVGRNINRAISALRSRQAPNSRISDEAAVTTQERVDQGVPIEDIIRAYRLSLRVIHNRFLELAKERGIPAEQILECSNLLWAVGDWFTATAAMAYRSYAVGDAVRETMRRADLLRDLLAGSLTDQRIRAVATSLNIDPATQYSVFYALPAAPSDMDVVRAALERQVNPPPVMAEFAGRWVGLTVQPSSLRPAKFVLAVGPSVDLTELPESARVADRIAVIVKNEPPGTYTLADVSWRLAALAETSVSKYLHAKYVQPVLDLGEFGELLLASMKAFLQMDLNITRAAQQMLIHSNTLRYRLAKYEEIVGISMTKTGAVVEVAWALGLPLRSEPNLKTEMLGKNPGTPREDSRANRLPTTA